MPLLQVVMVLLVVGVLLWLVDRFIPMASSIKSILNAVGNNCRSVVAAERVWAYALPYQHSHWQIVTAKDDTPELLEVLGANGCAG